MGTYLLRRGAIIPAAAVCDCVLLGLFVAKEEVDVEKVLVIGLLYLCLRLTLRPEIVIRRGHSFNPDATKDLKWSEAEEKSWRTDWDTQQEHRDETKRQSAEDS